MKLKLPEKLVHVVPWMSKAEWDQVLEYLYSSDVALRKYALQRISAWKARFGNGTPVAVETTADLVRCQVLDSSGQLDTDDLVLLYGTALVRFVNLITERKQRKVAVSLRRLAGKMNIPEWIVNLRHDITHHKLPTLKWCRRGCKYVLDWLQQEYWSLQLGRHLEEHWDSQSEKEDDEEDGPGELDELVVRRKREADQKARELLISYENEQFQVFDKYREKRKDGKQWPACSSDSVWIIIQIKDFALESRDALIDTLITDGFLVPTMEQLGSLGIVGADTVEPTAPSIPRIFLHFWQPLLKAILTPTFTWLFLEKLFEELRFSGDLSQHRMYYLSGWISEIFSCSSCKNQTQNPHPNEPKGQKKARLREQIFSKQVKLPWNKLLSVCLEAPCIATPHLLQQITDNMEPPLALDTQRKLHRLCCIYTQPGDPAHSPSTERPNHPIYTVESLQRTVQLKSQKHKVTNSLRPGSMSHSLQPASLRHTVPDAADQSEQLCPDMLAERVAALRGSPWQVCTDNVKWNQFPLGRIPGQTEDPSYLMAESHSTMAVFDQHIEVNKISPHTAFNNVCGPNRTGSDGPFWTHGELSKLKCGLQLF